MRCLWLALFLTLCPVLITSAAHAVNPGFFAAISGQGGGAAYLDSVIDSVVVDLDATVEDSYGGTGETWANLIASPADGAAQTDYDAFLGDDGSAAADDPTFTGSAGDSGAYFLLDGADYFRGSASSNPTTLNTLHQDTVDWWIAFAYRTASPTFSNNKSLFDTRFDSGGVSTEGSLVQENPRIVRRAGGSNTVTNLGSLSGGTDYIYIISRSSTGKFTHWINTTTGTDVTQAWSANSAGAGTNLFTIGGQNATGGANQVEAGTRFYGFYAGNEFLDDTKATAIIEHICARHNRNYTGSCL